MPSQPVTNDALGICSAYLDIPEIPEIQIDTKPVSAPASHLPIGDQYTAFCIYVRQRY